METLRIYEEMDMHRPCAAGRPIYAAGAAEAVADHPLVGDVRGVGLMCGMEMMADKATRTPYDASRRCGPTPMAMRAGMG